MRANDVMAARSAAVADTALVVDTAQPRRLREVVGLAR